VIGFSSIPQFYFEGEKVRTKRGALFPPSRSACFLCLGYRRVALVVLCVTVLERARVSLASWNLSLEGLCVCDFALVILLSCRRAAALEPLSW